MRAACWYMFFQVGLLGGPIRFTMSSRFPLSRIEKRVFQADERAAWFRNLGKCSIIGGVAFIVILPSVERLLRASGLSGTLLGNCDRIFSMKHSVWVRWPVDPAICLSYGLQRWKHDRTCGDYTRNRD